METEIQKLTGVPRDEVDNKVARIQASPRYLSHVVIPEGNNKSTIVVVLSLPGDPGTLDP
jgi:hypothetical protein